MVKQKAVQKTYVGSSLKIFQTYLIPLTPTWWFGNLALCLWWIELQSWPHRLSDKMLTISSIFHFLVPTMLINSSWFLFRLEIFVLFEDAENRRGFTDLSIESSYLWITPGQWSTLFRNLGESNYLLFTGLTHDIWSWTQGVREGRLMEILVVRSRGFKKGLSPPEKKSYVALVAAESIILCSEFFSRCHRLQRFLDFGTSKWTMANISGKLMPAKHDNLKESLLIL